MLATGKTQISTNYPSINYRFGSFQGYCDRMMRELSLSDHVDKMAIGAAQVRASDDRA